MGMFDLMLEQIGKTYGKQLEEFAKNYAQLCEDVRTIKQHQLDMVVSLAGAGDVQAKELLEKWQQEETRHGGRNNGNGSGAGRDARTG